MASSYELIASSMSALGILTIVLALKGGRLSGGDRSSPASEPPGPLTQRFGDEAALDAE